MPRLEPLTNDSRNTFCTDAKQTLPDSIRQQGEVFSFTNN